MNVRPRFALGLVLMLILNLAAGLWALERYRQIAQHEGQLREQGARILATALDTQVHFRTQIQEWKNLLLRGQEPDLRARYRARFESEETNTQTSLTALIALLADQPNPHAAAERFREQHRALGHAYREALAQHDLEHSDAYLRIDRQVRGIDRAPAALLDAVVDGARRYEEAQLAQLAERTRAAEHQGILLMSLLMSAAVLSLLWLLDRSVARPIAAATAIARRVSAGDFSTSIQVRGRDEAAQMLLALKQMQQNLGRSQEQLRHSQERLRQTNAVLAEERAQLAERVRERTAELDRANAELARSARAKDEFLAAMSHELRTPLTSILGLSETLGEGLMGPLGSIQKRALRTIHDNGQHLLELINDILDMSRVASGHMTLRWDLIPVEQLAEAARRMIAPAAERKSIKVALDLDPEARLIRGDGRRLKQLLINLLGNAVKFTPEGGRIGLEVRADQTAGLMRFLVWDTGVGIPPDQRERLFEPFVQLDSRPARQYDGSGLGLALASGMAELHGGRIEVESAPGAGSRFEVILPWTEETQNVTQPLSEAESRAPRKAALSRLDPPARVLLVEDNASNREMIAHALSTRGCAITTASSGPEALHAATQAPPELILMDVQMPGMDGLETTRRLRAVPALHRLPILALTALAMPGDREQCLEAGMDDYLSKPVGLDELHASVLNWVRRARAGA